MIQKLKNVLRAHAQFVEMIKPPQVGQIVWLKVALLGNLPGTLGVCFHVYNLGKGPAGQYIFENGEYDGFSPSEQEKYLEWVGDCEELKNYKFTNVIRVSRDYQAGIFNPAFCK